MIWSKEFIIELHERLIAATGGRRGIREIERIDSALQSIQQTFDGNDLHPSPIEKAARLAYALCTSHPFIDGNKRIAMHVMALMLRSEGLPYVPSNNEVVRIGFSLASGGLTYEDLVQWVKDTIAEASRRDRTGKAA
ncbi:MAG: type II toxin-antitoxin system death-on-curing family toxin [Candidatus Izemoplasmatales bacterium]